MDWEHPHPFNVDTAYSYNHCCSDEEATRLVGMAIADRLAGIEEALSALVLMGNGEAQRGFADVLARRAELEAQEPAPRREG